MGRHYDLGLGIMGFGDHHSSFLRVRGPSTTVRPPQMRLNVDMNGDMVRAVLTLLVDRRRPGLRWIGIMITGDRQAFSVFRRRCLSLCGVRRAPI